MRRFWRRRSFDTRNSGASAERRVAAAVPGDPTSPDFFATALLPHLPAAERGARGHWLARAVHRRRDGRVTVEWVAQDGLRVFAKLRPDGRCAGAHAALRALWDGGFGAGDGFRVAEPIAHLPELGLLVTRPAPGDCQWPGAGPGGAVPDAGLRACARWLAALHAAPVRTESDAGPRSDALELAAARALAERNPESRPVLAAALAELMARADRLREPRPRVQTHGTFTAGHVFVSRDCVTAIDLDEAHPGDPAEDLAYFAFWLRFGPVREGVGPAAAPDAVKLFLDEYARRHPVDAGALAYHWSVQVVQHWAMALRKRQPSPRAVVRRGFLAAEFAAVPSLAGAG